MVLGLWGLALALGFIFKSAVSGKGCFEMTVEGLGCRVRGCRRFGGLHIWGVGGSAWASP